MKPRLKYKALYQAAETARRDAERQRDRLRGWLDRLAPFGERIAKLWVEASDAGLKAPRLLAYPDWLAFAAYISAYQAPDVRLFEEPGFIDVRWRGEPVIYQNESERA